MSKLKRVNVAGRPTAVELERRKTRAMDVATKLFIQNGYAATSLVDIARGAGVATRTIYQHFGDKEAMFREVVFARDFQAASEEVPLEEGDTLFSALQRAGRIAYSLTFNDRSVGLMRLMIAESQRFPDFMKKTARTIFARVRRNYAQLFQNLENAGLLPAGDHARSAELFVDVVLGSYPIMAYTKWGDGPPSDSDLDERIELFICGRFGVDLADSARSRTAKLEKAA